ncbi:MAG: DEAD/DEAH box helicase [bacterium]|nr:DEAD/DEAH box helicase [bacterium]MDZ4284341.1 DEAD/DEAH box helicase [Patescibacteria group bacterium]
MTETEQVQQNTQVTFYGLGIAPGLLAALDGLGYVSPTPIQSQSIPIAIEGKDIVGIAQTGTGKTLAFGIPMLQTLAREKGQGLVVVPTRELALQVNEQLQSVGRSAGLRSAVLIGGQSMGPQMRELRSRPHILVVTPGRLIDHLRQKTLGLQSVRVLVLDEADRMLDMGFLPQMKTILSAVPAKRQTMLFSATLSSAIMRIATDYMQFPVRIEIAPSGTTVERVSQEIFVVGREEKPRQLLKVLAERGGSVLVFTRTKYGASRLARMIRGAGETCAELHSNRSLGQRRDALDGFKIGKYRVLVATDIASRGIDVQGIELVLNYDLPAQSEDYVHRIGRTARAGAAGHAISFALPNEKRGIRAIESFIKKSIRISEISPLAGGAREERPARPPRSPRVAYAAGRGRPETRDRGFRRPHRRAGRGRRF